MNGFVADATIMAPPRCELRRFCLDRLQTEIARARKEVFGLAARYAPGDNYTRDYKSAVRAENGGYSWPHRSYNGLQLPYHWLTLIGYRIAIERRLFLGGMDAASIRAVEVLGAPPSDAMQWDVDLLFKLYCNTRLRSEWDYDGYAFRPETGRA